MDSGWWGRVIFTVGLIFIAVLALLTTFVYREDDHIPKWIPESLRDRISLGLDLQGGVHLVLGVQIEKAIDDKVDVLADSMRRDLAENGVRDVEISRPRGRKYAANLKFGDPKGLPMFKGEVLNKYNVFQIADESGGNTIEISLSDEYVEYLKRSIFEQVMKTLSNRIDEFNVKESSLSQRGEDQILVELPGVQDPEAAKKRFGTTARLEFKLVDDESGFIQTLRDKLPEGITMDFSTFEGPNNQALTEAFLICQDRQKLLDFLNNQELVPLPPDRQILLGTFMRQGERWFRTYYLRKSVALTGDYIQDAQVLIDPMDNRPYVFLQFDNAGAKIFAQITEENVRKRFAIVLDNVVNSAPVINERIGGGSARITLGGMRGYDEILTEASDLAAVLRAGALPADVEVLFKREVGPSLGADSIEKGFTSIMLGLILVLIFMVIYYRISGVVADIAVLLNILFILAIMSAFGATLTMPGMAGITLTLGMAVDANVIINERVKEELRDGRSIRAAVETGYAKAFSAIFDANITTILAAIILYQFGTGPIRGFAVTLSIGVACSLFTAVFVTRWIMDYLTLAAKVKRLSI